MSASGLQEQVEAGVDGLPHAITGATRHSLWLDVAVGRAMSKFDGDGVGAGDARHGSAAPVDGAPALAALGPGNTAHEAVQLIELRLDHDLPSGVDQPPFAVLEK